MSRLVFTTAARRDFVSIFDYIARESTSVATGRRFAASLRGKCAELAALPGQLGRARPELRPDIRSYAFRNYVIFFRYRGDLFEVVRVIEGHRDIDTAFAG